MAPCKGVSLRNQRRRLNGIFVSIISLLPCEQALAAINRAVAFDARSLASLDRPPLDGLMESFHDGPTIPSSLDEAIERLLRRILDGKSITIDALIENPDPDTAPVVAPEASPEASPETSPETSPEVPSDDDDAPTGQDAAPDPDPGNAPSAPEAAAIPDVVNGFAATSSKAAARTRLR